jgi:hypothetical protein
MFFRTHIISVHMEIYIFLNERRGIPVFQAAFQIQLFTIDFGLFCLFRVWLLRSVDLKPDGLILGLFNWPVFDNFYSSVPESLMGIVEDPFDGRITHNQLAKMFNTWTSQFQKYGQSGTELRDQVLEFIA